MTESTANFWAVVPAAGAGRRMGAAQPKQYLALLGRPMLLHTLERLGSCPGIRGVALGIAADDDEWTALDYRPEWLRCVCEGGAERAQTVRNVLRAMRDFTADMDWVLVHDAARPCVSHAEIRSLMELAAQGDGGLLGLPVSDTVKRADAAGRVLATVPREGLWRAQTPQMFRYAALLAALEEGLAAGRAITDEASAMEQAGYHPLLVAGRAENLKVTHPEDLRLAELYLRWGEA